MKCINFECLCIGKFESTRQSSSRQWQKKMIWHILNWLNKDVTMVSDLFETPLPRVCIFTLTLSPVGSLLNPAKFRFSFEGTWTDLLRQLRSLYVCRILFPLFFSLLWEASLLATEVDCWTIRLLNNIRFLRLFSQSFH